jgi:hypothetical protein
VLIAKTSQLLSPGGKEKRKILRPATWRQLMERWQIDMIVY